MPPAPELSGAFCAGTRSSAAWGAVVRGVAAMAAKTIRRAVLAIVTALIPDWPHRSEVVVQMVLRPHF
jgi:hypothetical protein